MTDHTTFHYGHAELASHHPMLLPTLERVVTQRVPKGGRLFDCGCGNGSVAAHLTSLGYRVTGIDPSTEGIAMGKTQHPECDLRSGSVYDDLSPYGTFPLVYSLEVIEHLYYPRKLA